METVTGGWHPHSARDYSGNPLCTESDVSSDKALTPFEGASVEHRHRQIPQVKARAHQAKSYKIFASHSSNTIMMRRQSGWVRLIREMQRQTQLQCAALPPKRFCRKRPVLEPPVVRLSQRKRH